MIYLQISTAQGPAECRIFARFVLKKLLAEAEARNVKAEIAGETADKHGILSAVLILEGAAADTLAQSWQGTLQWVCASPVRPKHPRKNWYIGIFRLPENPKCRLKAKSSSKPAARAAKAGSTSINRVGRPRHTQSQRYFRAGGKRTQPYQSRKFKSDILVNGIPGKVREVLEMIESSE
ncbi:peptide chain release factor-like protein [Neisseria elongata subsp. glycolytica ATCC 29315]|uniref:Peptide chain release factor-like protein n=1 Tax=Neisseria elongata subsp. glycolytica ATCC 29315 TaxID=546263 RepID=D4DV55_NEIEG|nr:peptide chain release factor-like protein [Neisseria elongata subsp. glycolytica ATCC 29315]